MAEQLTLTAIHEVLSSNPSRNANESQVELEVELTCSSVAFIM